MPEEVSAEHPQCTTVLISGSAGKSAQRVHGGLCSHGPNIANSGIMRKRKFLSVTIQREPHTGVIILGFLTPLLSSLHLPVTVT